MSILRALLNNGFFILLLITAVTLYLVYSDDIKKDHGIYIDTEAVPTHKEFSKPSNVTQNAVEKKQVSSLNKATIHQDSPANQKPQTTKAKVKAKTANETSTANPQNNAAIDVVAVLSNFNSFPEAINAARSAFYAHDLPKAEEIYYSLVAKTPTAEVLLEFGNVLAQSGKLDLANIAWIEAGQILIKTNRVYDAISLGNHLSSISSNASQTILNNAQQALSMQQSQQQKVLLADQQNQQQQADARQKKWQAEAKLREEMLKNYQAKIKQQLEAQNAYWRAQIEDQFANKESYLNQQAARLNEYNKQMQDYYQRLRFYYNDMQQQAPQGYRPPAQ